MPIKDLERRRQVWKEASARYRQNHPDKVSAYDAWYKLTHVEILRERSTKSRAEQDRLINAYKNRPCADCQGWYEPYQMQFDHRDPKTKSFGISGKRYGFRKKLVEIQKCDVVCANCHAIRTHKQIISGVFIHMIKRDSQKQNLTNGNYGGMK